MDHTESFQIQIISDLHLEIERTQDQPLYIYEFPVCALAILAGLEMNAYSNPLPLFFCGNTTSLMIRKQSTALEEFSKRCSLARATEGTESTPGMGEFILLNRTRYDVSPTLTIIGCTLWSALNLDDLDILSWSLTDLKRIGSFNPASYESGHKIDLDWLTSTLEDIRSSSSRRVIVSCSHS